MPTRDELMTEAESLQKRYQKSTSEEERARLRKRYQEIDRALQALKEIQEPNSSKLPLVETRSSTNILNSFPRKEHREYSSVRGEFHRYILPSLLVGLVAIVLFLIYFPEYLNKGSESLADPTVQVSAEKRIQNAEELVQKGDESWKKGYAWWNIEEELKEAQGHYKAAWKELTGIDWQTDIVNKGAKPILDSADARLLYEKLLYRLPELDRTLNGLIPLR